MPQYEGGEPCKICGHRLVKMEERVLPTETSAFPTEILPGFLYLGSYDNASRSELLKAMGVTHILNVRQPALSATMSCEPSLLRYLAHLQSSRSVHTACMPLVYRCKFSPVRDQNAQGLQCIFLG